MAITRSRGARAAALLGAAALAVGAFSLTGSAAFAAEPVKPGDGGTGSITVYKL